MAFSWCHLGYPINFGLVLYEFSIGRDAVLAAANGFEWLTSAAFDGIAFALPDWVKPASGTMNFVTSAVLPILVIIPMFDILTYIWCIAMVG